MAKKREIFMCASLFCPVVVHCSLDADEDQRHDCPEARSAPSIVVAAAAATL